MKKKLMVFRWEGNYYMAFHLGRMTNDDTSTLMGPASFCQGYSAGGGDSCTDVPAGCYIDVPIDNTAPQVECDL